jgi:tetratricopeptide (TPR) repeat protein
MRAYKILFNSVLVVVALMALFFFGFSDSYKLSLEAKMKYMLGEYDEARVIAKEAFDLDPYNRMAISILSQSKISAQMADYVKDSKKYLDKIEKISKKSDFSYQDRIKIKMMCEVMIGRYRKLNPTVMTDKALYELCTKNYQNFKKIYEELAPTTSK